MEDITDQELTELFDENGEYHTATRVSARQMEAMYNRIKSLTKENENLEAGLRIAINQLNNVPCFQGCNNGVIQESEDEIYQCQWCGEQEAIKSLLT